VTPQFHAVFEELFTTVVNALNPDQLWIELFMNEREYYGPDDNKEDNDAFQLPPIADEWLPLDEQPLQEIVVPKGGLIRDAFLDTSITPSPIVPPPLHPCVDPPDDLSQIDEGELPDDHDVITDKPGQTTSTLKNVLDPTREEQFGRGNAPRSNPIAGRTAEM
jgi:hypothetical protein